MLQPGDPAHSARLWIRVYDHHCPCVRGRCNPVICDGTPHLVLNRGATCTFQVFIPTTWLGPKHHLTPWITAWNLPHSPNAGSARSPHNRVGIQQTRGQPPWLSRITIHPTLMLQSAICVNQMLFWTLSWWSFNCQPHLRISIIFLKAEGRTQSSVLLFSATHSPFKESPTSPPFLGGQNEWHCRVGKKRGKTQRGIPDFSNPKHVTTSCNSWL